jgi:hypothetical protein
VFDISVVQNLCRAIAEEGDPDRTTSLLKALREVIKDQQEEFRFRLLYMSRRCAASVGEKSDPTLSIQVGANRPEEAGPRTISFGRAHKQSRKSLFGSVCLTLLREEFKPDEL